MRGTGRTTKTLRDLPEGGWFVAHNMQGAEYALRIARDVLKRTDIRFLTLADFSWPPDRIRGLRFPALAMDHHAAELATDDQLSNYKLAVFCQSDEKLKATQSRGHRRKSRTAR